MIIKKCKFEVDKYPVTIIRSRYGGVYEGAEWIAFNDSGDSKFIAEATGDDSTCSGFFCRIDNPKIEMKNEFDERLFIGIGKTPQQAYEDLIKKVVKK